MPCRVPDSGNRERKREDNNVSENRIQILEEKQAFLEDTVQRLNDALTDQQRQLSVLQGSYDVLKQKYREITQAGVESPEPIDQKPPHY